MKISKLSIIRHVAVVAVILTGTAVLMAAYGSSSDPLITKSYLDQVLKPSILSSFDEALETERTSLETDFTKQISDFTTAMSQKTTVVTTAKDYYTTKTLSSGNVLAVTAGSRVLLTEGSAALTSGELADTSVGTALSSGGTLGKYHLYIASKDCQISASTNVTVLVK